MIGFVIPTLGTRESALSLCIQSIVDNGISDICIVAPASAVHKITIRHPEVQIMVDARQGLAAAINLGINALPRHIKYVNWLGDDDQLVTGSSAELCRSFKNDSAAVLAYGMCEYINGSGQRLFLNRSARWSEQLMRFGPQLISQPAMLFKRETFDRLGGLDESLLFAFDLDLLLKLRQIGKFIRVPVTTAKYCWHEGALTVKSRQNSVAEASKVRERHLHRRLRRLAPLWEFCVRWIIFTGGRIVSIYAVRKSKP